MNTHPFGDLKDIFTAPPTEARYSWVIHSRNETVEGTATHLHKGETSEATRPSLTKKNSLNPFQEDVTPEQMSGELQQSEEEVAHKRSKTEDTNEMLLNITSDSQHLERDIVTPPQRSSSRRDHTDKGSPPPKSYPRVRNLLDTTLEKEEEDKENVQDISTNNSIGNEEKNSSAEEYSSTRVFGEGYGQRKEYLKSQRLACMTNALLPSQKVQDGNQTIIVDYHYKNLRLQEEINSATKKISKLNNINQSAFKRKGELQKEVLDAFKKISELEASRHSLNEKHRELTHELKITKQRVGEAEREAAHAIGCSSKYQRELIDAENKKQKYFDDLNFAEKRISKLEDLMKNLEMESRKECETKVDLQRRIYESEAALKMATNDNTNFKNKVDIRDKEMSILERKLERETLEKRQFETKSRDLSDKHNTLTGDLKRVETKFEIAQRTIEQYSTKLSAEKEKFQLATTLKNNAEKDLRETKQQLSKEHSQKEFLTTECSAISEKYKELKKHNDKAVKQNNELRRENRDLKDRVLYLELYQKISDKKSRPETSGRDKRKTCFLNTLDEIKTKSRGQKPRSRNGSTDSWENTWDQSQRVQSNWSQGFKQDHNTEIQSGHESVELDRLSVMSAEIEKLQKEQKVINHVTAESCASGSRSPSRMNTAREDASSRLSKNNNNSRRNSQKSPREGAQLLSENDTMPSFCEDKSEEQTSGDNLVTFSDLLHDDTNRDIANALM